MRRGTLALSILVAVVASLAFVPTVASATTAYCGILVQPFSRCTSSVFGVFHYNEARYPGSGTVSVCERADAQSGVLLSRFCHDNVAGSGGDLTNVGSPSSLYVGNNSDHQHTVDGSAST